MYSVKIVDKYIEIIKGGINMENRTGHKCPLADEDVVNEIVTDTGDHYTSKTAI